MKKTSDYLAMLNKVAESNDLATLGQLDTEVSVYYGYMNVQYGQLEADRELWIELFTIDHTDIKHTNASLDRAWNITADGQNMIKMKRELDALNTILKSIKNQLIRLSIEKRESE